MFALDTEAFIKLWHDLTYGSSGWKNKFFKRAKNREKCEKNWFSDWNMQRRLCLKRRKRTWKNISFSQKILMQKYAFIPKYTI